MMTIIHYCDHCGKVIGEYGEWDWDYKVRDKHRKEYFTHRGSDGVEMSDYYDAYEFCDDCLIIAEKMVTTKNFWTTLHKKIKRWVLKGQKKWKLEKWNNKK